MFEDSLAYPLFRLRESQENLRDKAKIPACSDFNKIEID